MQEVRVLNWLSNPGHSNVMRLVELLEDDACLYLVLQYCDGGELFDQVRESAVAPQHSGCL